MRRNLSLVALAILIAGVFFYVAQIRRNADEADLGRQPRSTDAARDESIRRDLRTPTTKAAPNIAATAPVEAAKARGGVVVIGKTVDDRRRPIAAELEILADGKEPFRAESASDGRFRVETGAKRDDTRFLTVVASNGSTKAAIASIDLGFKKHDTIDAGTLVVADGPRFIARVTRDGAPVAGARVVIGSKRHLYHGPFLTGADGTTRPIVLPEGFYDVAGIFGDGERADADIELRETLEAPLELKLEEAWTLVVAVVDEATATPVPGVAIAAECTERRDNFAMSFTTLTSRPWQKTNDRGETRLLGLSPRSSVKVRIRPPAEGTARGYSQTTPNAHAKPGSERVVITIPKGETFTFPIVEDETAGPPDGATVRLSVPVGYGGGVPPEKGKVVGRNLVFEGIPPSGINFLATAEDGSMAIVRLLRDARTTKIGSDAKFKKPRTLTVTVRERDGKPVTDRNVGLNVGGSPVGQAQALDAEGVARFSNIYPERVSVTLGALDSDEFQRVQVGTVDLKPPGDGKLDVVLDPERPCVLHVRLDGEARLPQRYTLRLDRSVIAPIDEDPGEGVLRFSIRPESGAENVIINASAPGCLPTTVTLPTGATGATSEATLSFATGGKVRVHVRMPSDLKHEVFLQTYDDTNSRWKPAGRLGGAGAFATSEKRASVLQFDSLAPGLYRACDALTGIVGDSIQLAPGGASEATIDLSRAGVVTVRVEGPADEQYEPAAVLIEAEGLEPTTQRAIDRGGVAIKINTEGTIRVPGDRPIKLHVAHAILAADAEAGVAEVREANRSVTLKLVRGAEATFRVSLPKPSPRGGDRDWRILLFRGEITESPVFEREITVRDGINRFGGFEPGRYTLWCDPLTAAPIVLKDIELGGEATDLGEWKPLPGATIRCKVPVAEGAKPTANFLFAESIDRPKYTRRGSGTAAEIEIRGLGTGTFRLRGVNTNPAKKSPEVEIESPGFGEIEATLDLR